ncbi:MAG: FAD-binding oxidoreductase, partial [OM182 bacterium]|nr:FAD-binding oxidoreductase [OM182 bacterium]
MKCTKAELLEALHDLVGDAGLKTSPADLDTYGKDWTRVYTPSPVAIVLPADTDEVVALVKFAQRMEVPLVPSG